MVYDNQLTINICTQRILTWICISNYPGQKRKALGKSSNLKKCLKDFKMSQKCNYAIIYVVTNAYINLNFSRKYAQTYHLDQHITLVSQFLSL